MKSPRKQRGATLLVGLVMLVVLTLLGLAAINTSTSNLKIVGNVQIRQDAMNAAQAAINQLLSNPAYFEDPASAPLALDVATPAGTVRVTLERPCILSAIPIRRSDPFIANDTTCMGSSAERDPGRMGQNTGGADSECSRVTWRVKATVSDTATRGQAEVTEGIVMKKDKALANAAREVSTNRCS